MREQAKIGVLDSGSGGLTVLKALTRIVDVDAIYFGDLANMPYGDRSAQELQELTMKGLALLKQRGVNYIINACNSMSASMAISVAKLSHICKADTIEMIEPTVSYVMEKYANKKVGLIGTLATVKANGYTKSFLNQDKEIYQFAIPGLVDAIEQNDSKQNLIDILNPVIDNLIKKHCDILILGCTHYLFALNAIEHCLDKSEMIIVDPAKIVAQTAKIQFNLENYGGRNIEFLISAKSEVFNNRARSLFPNYEISIQKV